MSTALTFYWEDIFPTYDAFNEFVSTLDVVNYKDPLEVAFNEFCWNTLSRHFSHQNIRYTEPWSFLFEFGNVYSNKFRQFLNQKKMIDYTYSLTPADIAMVNEAINNGANNPNTEVDDPTKPLKYISAQTYSLVTDNKMRAYLNAIESMPSLNIYEFLRGNKNNRNDMHFVDLFMVIQPNTYALFKKGD